MLFFSPRLIWRQLMWISHTSHCSLNHTGLLTENSESQRADGWQIKGKTRVADPYEGVRCFWHPRGVAWIQLSQISTELFRVIIVILYVQFLTRWRWSLSGGQCQSFGDMWAHEQEKDMNHMLRQKSHIVNCNLHYLTLFITLYHFVYNSNSN